MKTLRFLFSAVVIETIGIGLIIFIFTSESDTWQTWLPERPASTSPTHELEGDVAPEGVAVHERNGFVRGKFESALERISNFLN